MATELETPGSSETQDPALPADTAETQDPTKTPRSRSKIAKLPRVTREQLNELLADGFSYREVIEKLGEECKHLTEMDLSRWFHAGHRVWLKHQTWLEHVTDSFENAKNLVDDGKAFSIHEANLHIAATTINETIIGCDMAALPNLLKQKPESHYSLL